MIDDKKNKQNVEEGSNAFAQNLNQVNEQKKVELTEEQRLKRAVETGKLFEDKEDLIKARAERERKKKLEVVELQSGAKFTIGEIERIVTAAPSPYAPLFSYGESDYFKELYRMYYPDRNYKEWPKPFYVSVLFKELIYDRFDKAVFTALDIHNPIIASKKCRERKLFQHLNDVGQQEELQFRDDVVNIAKTITTDGDSYSFRKKMWELHKVPYQLDFFKEQKAN
jgi:P63C domain